MVTIWPTKWLWQIDFDSQSAAICDHTAQICQTPIHPAASDVSNVSTGLSCGSGRQSQTPEVSSSNLSEPASSRSQGSIGLADFMSLDVLRGAKKWRLDRLSKAEVAGLITHHMKISPPEPSSKAQLVSMLMEFAASDAECEVV